MGLLPLSLTHCIFSTSLHQLLIVSFSITLWVWANPIDSVVFCGELQAPVRGNTSLPWGDWIVPDYRYWLCLLPAWKWQELLLIACLPPPGTSLVSLYKKWVIIGFPFVIKYYHCSLWNAVKRDNKRLKGGWSGVNAVEGLPFSKFAVCAPYIFGKFIFYLFILQELHETFYRHQKSMNIKKHSANDNDFNRGTSRRMS